MPAGRPRKPIALRKLEGDPGKRKKKDPETTANSSRAPKLPTAPRYLSAIAKSEWRRLGKQLEAAGKISGLDLRAFEMLCTTYEEWRTAQDKTRELSMVVYTPSGYPMTNPWFTNEAKLADRYARLLMQFGLTPASSEKVPTAQAEEGEDPATAWLNRGRSA